MVVPNNHGFLGVFGGYHHLRKHPFLHPLQLAAGTLKILKMDGFQKESPFTQFHFQVSGDTLIEVYPP